MTKRPTSPTGATAVALSAAVEATAGDLDLHVELTVERDEVVAVVGPNGAGKTTLLRVLAGLVPLRRGMVAVDGTVVEDTAAGIRLPPEERGVGMVFQDHRLFPNLTLAENVAFGLRARGVPRPAARSRAAEWLDRVGLAGMGGRRPAQVSGGQAQRVALARALACEPGLLLLDEPLAAADASARVELRRALRAELGGGGGGRILVTHDPIEAASLSDRLVAVEDGRVTQDGPLAEVTGRPRSRWVATMVGLNLLEGTAGGACLRLPCGQAVATATRLSGPAYAAFRPNAVTLHRLRPEGSARNVWPGEAADMHVAGDRARVAVTGPVPLVAEVTAAAVAELRLADGGRVWASVKATDVDVYPA